jgi:hypothetical protein
MRRQHTRDVGKFYALTSENLAVPHYRLAREKPMAARSGPRWSASPRRDAVSIAKHASRTAWDFEGQSNPAVLLTLGRLRWLVGILYESVNPIH